MCYTSVGLHSFGFYSVNFCKVMFFFLVKQSGFGENQGDDRSGVKELLRKERSII